MTKVVMVDNEPVCPNCGNTHMLVEVEIGSLFLDGVRLWPDSGWEYDMNYDVGGQAKRLYCSECEFEVDIEDVEPVPTRCLNCGMEIPMYVDVNRPTLIWAQDVPAHGHICGKCRIPLEEAWAALGPDKPNWWDWLKQKADAGDFPAERDNG
jgi:hypothetical protein